MNFDLMLVFFIYFILYILILLYFLHTRRNHIKQHNLNRNGFWIMQLHDLFVFFPHFTPHKEAELLRWRLTPFFVVVFFLPYHCN